MLSKQTAAVLTLAASILIAAAINAGPLTPPAGPDSTVRTGSRAAIRADKIPPFDCMTRTRAPLDFLPAACPALIVRPAFCSISFRYRLITGAR